MNDTPQTTLKPPRIALGRPMLIAGLADHFTFDNLGGLPALWRRFAPHIGAVPGQIGTVTYGVCYNTDDETGSFDYIAGVEVTDAAATPTDFATLRLKEQRYAIFTHEAHISAIRGTFMAIFNDWLPTSCYKSAEAPPFERYDNRFDPHTGMGGFEIWIPVKT